MNLGELVPPRDLPAADARVPGVAVRLVLAIAGVLLTPVVYGSSGWLAVGIIFSLLAAWAPDYLLTWVLIVFLALGELGRPAALSWQLLVLLAGVHLLHVLATLALGLPWRSWIQPSVFTRPLLRFIEIQIPVQLLAVVTLLLLAPNGHGHRPLTVAEFSVVGASALAGLTVMLLGRGADGAQSLDSSGNDRSRRDGIM
jgi:hypothetical protein